MTKDEMLDELSVLQERFNNGMGWRDGNYAEALDMAIELLEAEQTEPSLVKDSPSLVKDLVEDEPTTEESSMVAENENCIDCVHFEQCTTNGWTDCHYMPIADCPWK